MRGSKLYPTLVLQKTEMIDLFRREEEGDDAAAEPLHKQKHRRACEQCGKDAEPRPFNNVESESRRDLKRFAGNEGDDDLKHHHAEKRQPAPDAVPVDPGAEAGRIADKTKHGLCHEKIQRGRHEENARRSERKTQERTAAFREFWIAICVQVLFHALMIPQKMKESLAKT